MIRNTPKAALKTPIEMLHAERFFTSSIKLCAYIRALQIFEDCFREGGLSTSLRTGAELGRGFRCYEALAFAAAAFALSTCTFACA